MPSTFTGIDIASRAIRAFERALNVTGHNLANVGTRGYSRQVISFQQTPGITFYGLRPLTLGTGMYVSDINRVRDMFLQGRYLESNYEGSRLDQLVTTLRTIEDIYREPSADGLGNMMAAMFDAWNQLSTSPGDDAIRLNLRMKASIFASRVKEAHGAMTQHEILFRAETDATIAEINDIAERISRVNEQIRRDFAIGGTPNDLMDQRDVLIEDLSRLVDVRTVELSDHSIMVYVNQHTLVDQITSRPLPTNYDPATSSIIDGTRTILIRGGRLAGLLQGLHALDNYRSQLDTLANEVRSAVNALHVTGINQNGTTGVAFFSGSNGASDFEVDAAILTDLRNIATSTTGEPGDGELARQISAIRDMTLAGLGGRSPASYYSQMIGRLAIDTHHYLTSSQAHESLRTQLDEQRHSISGVNADEEMANMLRFQRSFQAAAKLLSVLDQTTEELIRTFGR